MILGHIYMNSYNFDMKNDTYENRGVTIKRLLFCFFTVYMLEPCWSLIVSNHFFFKLT